MACYRAWAANAWDRDFTVVEYRTRASGEFMPERPGECRRRVGDARACRLVVNHWRVRPTLSLGQLLVLQCRVHRGAFTLYPCNLAPYLRSPILMATPDGQEPVSVGESKQSALQGTMFAAAQEARESQRWYSRDSGQGLLAWRGSRLRQLQRAVSWLGLGAELDDAERVERAAILGVEALQLKEAAQRALAGSVAEQGMAVCAILETMAQAGSESMACRLERLLWAGHHAGLWGRPWLWETAMRGWRKPLFRSGGTARPGACPAGLEPPTTWLVDGREGLV